MKCPYCDSLESKVVDSRVSEDCSAIRRRRECLNCNKRYTTYERIEIISIRVIKNNQERQTFDISKVKNGILKACEKRPVPLSTIEDTVNEIEKTLYNSMEKEVTSQHIGEMIMNKLKNIDEVAYVRFASVYRQFKDINTFMEELKKLLNE